MIESSALIHRLLFPQYVDMCCASCGRVYQCIDDIKQRSPISAMKGGIEYVVDTDCWATWLEDDN